MVSSEIISSYQIFTVGITYKSGDINELDFHG